MHLLQTKEYHLAEAKGQLWGSFNVHRQAAEREREPRSSNTEGEIIKPFSPFMRVHS